MPRDLFSIEQDDWNIVLIQRVIVRTFENISRFQLERNGFARLFDDVQHIITQAALRLGVQSQPFHDLRHEKSLARNS